MPGSVHCVSAINTSVNTTANINRIGMAGLHAHMVGNTNTQYRTKTKMNVPQTQKLAHVSDIGPIMQPQGRKRFLPGQVVYILAIFMFRWDYVMGLRLVWINITLCTDKLDFNIHHNINKRHVLQQQQQIRQSTNPQTPIPTTMQQQHQQKQQQQHKSPSDLPSSYLPEVARLLKHEQFLRTLLKYNICYGCVLRTFNIMLPRMYSDDESWRKILDKVMNIAEEKCQKQLQAKNKHEQQNKQQINQKQQQIKQQQQHHEQASKTAKSEDKKQCYSFGLGQFKVYLQQKKKQDHDDFCWLCTCLLQTPFLQLCANQIIAKIKQQHYSHKQKYKLNVKIHNMLAIKYQIFCNMVLADLQKLGIMNNTSIEAIRKQIVVPLFQKTGLDLKTVFKWKLSNILNHKPGQVLTLTSTITQDEQTVIVSMQLNPYPQFLQQLEQCLTNMLGPVINLQKVKIPHNKKGSRIDLQQETQQNLNYLANWTLSLMSRINNISPKQWLDMLQMPRAPLYGLEKIKKIQLKHKDAKMIDISIILQSENVMFCGKYVKFSRYLSQTPWIINKQRLTESSLQQEVQKSILRFFYPQSIAEKDIQIKFHAGGREDIDVRMLKGGRPFVIQFVHPRFCLSDIKIPTILQKIKQNLPNAYKSLPQISPPYPQQQTLIKSSLLQFYINSSTELAKVNSFRLCDSSYISKQLKQAEIQKIKHYVCYIKILGEGTFGNKDKEQLEKCHNLEVIQKTPVRVLHRRTLMNRTKIVHKMIFHIATKKSAVLQIWASAGTYIKQFVHGDLNRTKPNVGTLIGKQVDILQLDVGSLKQGQWVEGDYQGMRLGDLEWEKEGKQ